MPSPLYHRLTGHRPREQKEVEKLGVLWGTIPAVVAGGGPPCVKAFAGPLPPGQNGYTFQTDVKPTRPRRFWGNDGFVWEEGTDGVVDVPGKSDFVQIPVRIING